MFYLWHAFGNSSNSAILMCSKVGKLTRSVSVHGKAADLSLFDSSCVYQILLFNSTMLDSLFSGSFRLRVPLKARDCMKD